MHHNRHDGFRVGVAMKLIHVIEDNQEFLEALIAFLTDIGYQAQGFTSAEAYICHMNDPFFNHPVLVLSDVDMPGMCGLELAQEVRQKNSGVTYMLMTGNPGQLKQQYLSELKIEKVFNKPFQFSQLEQVLEGL